MAPNDTLKGWLSDRNIKPAEFARRVEYDRSNFHRLLNGNLWPSLELALRIERETEGALPMSAWAEAKAA
jgi:plasmid maintenance system antidote protein VapI